MKFVFTFLFAAEAFVSIAFPSQNFRPTYEHMVEVNKQWLNHNVPEGWMSFESDRMRIQHHLFLVHDNLSAQSTEGLSDAQCFHRARLLDTLMVYAEKAQFPLNTGHRVRTPYFIDDYGTACAVGYLIIASGHGETADFLHDQYNFDYLADMPKEPILAWADEFGFKFSELEWIQPAYQYYPTLRFLPVDTALKGSVWTAKHFSEEEMVCIGGSFTDNGYANFRCYDGQGALYESLLQYELGEVRDMAWIQPGHFVLVGAFELVDGTTKGFLNINQNSGFYIDLNAADFESHAIYQEGGYLYFDAYDGQSSSIHRIYFGATQGEELMRVNGKVNSIEKYGDQLVIGGDFTQATTTMDTLVHPNFVSWKDALLSSVGSPFEAEIRALRSIDAKLYAMGDCDVQDAASSCVQIYDGGTWLQGLDSLSIAELDLANGSSLWFNDVFKYQGKVLLGGFFEHCSIGPLNYYCSKNVVELSGTGNIEPFGFFNGAVHALAEDESGEVIVGGDFTNHTYSKDGGGWIQWSTFGVPFLARSAPGLVGVTQAKIYADDLLIYPTPARGELKIETSQRITSWRVFDMTGKEVQAEATSTTSGLYMDISQIKSGMYIVELNDDRGQAYRKEIIVGPC